MNKIKFKRLFISIFFLISLIELGIICFLILQSFLLESKVKNARNIIPALFAKIDYLQGNTRFLEPKQVSCLNLHTIKATNKKIDNVPVYYYLYENYKNVANLFPSSEITTPQEDVLVFVNAYNKKMKRLIENKNKNILAVPDAGLLY